MKERKILVEWRMSKKNEREKEEGKKFIVCDILRFFVDIFSSFKRKRKKRRWKMKEV